MVLSKMEISIILQRITEILSAIASNPFVYLPLIGAWIITSLYFIINHDEKHGHTYVMSTGIAHVFTAYIISPFAKQDLEWAVSDLRTIVVLILFAYGLLLIILGVMKAFPDFLAEFFGDPGHALAPGLMSVLYVEDKIPFGWLTFFIILVPVLIVSIIKIIRRFSR